MTITARYASTCTACQRPITPGQQIEWTKGSRAVRHTDCTARTDIWSKLAEAAPKKRITHCVGCGSPLDTFQQRRGFRFCSSDCVAERKLGGQSGYYRGQWHQGDHD